MAVEVAVALREGVSDGVDVAKAVTVSVGDGVGVSVGATIVSVELGVEVMDGSGKVGVAEPVADGAATVSVGDGVGVSVGATRVSMELGVEVANAGEGVGVAEALKNAVKIGDGEDTTVEVDEGVGVIGADWESHEARASAIRKRPARVHLLQRLILPSRMP